MKLSEVYTSVQGEGPNTGIPTQFIRFAGCNMRCPGWPCDTPQAIFPEEYRHEWLTLTQHQVMEQLNAEPAHLCVTGGEPFLQNGMDKLVEGFGLAGFTTDIFTNGSFEFPGTVLGSPNVYVIMDWKLMGSGEATTQLEQRKANFELLANRSAGGTAHVKFVVKNMDDLWEAKSWFDTLKTYRNAARITFWVGAAWGHIEDRKITNFVLEYGLPWRLNIQTHKHIWEPEARYT